MFQTISQSVDKKRKSLQIAGSKKNTIERLARDFLESKKTLSSLLPEIEITYNFKKDQLVLATKNKTVANELLFITKNLPAFLLEKSVVIGKILIL